VDKQREEQTMGKPDKTHSVRIQYDDTARVYEVFEVVDGEEEWIDCFDTLGEAWELKRKLLEVGPAMTAGDF
jgi:hypothetical protein